MRKSFVGSGQQVVPHLHIDIVRYCFRDLFEQVALPFCNDPKIVFAVFQKQRSELCAFNAFRPAVEEEGRTEVEFDLFSRIYLA